MIAGVIALTAVTVGGCMGTRAHVERRVLLIRPVSDGYEVADSGGRVVRVLPKPSGQVSFFSPNLETSFSTRVDAGTNTFVGTIAFRGEPAVELARSARAPQGGGDVPRIIWATADGRVAFLVVEGRVERVEYCSGVIKKRLVLQGVGTVGLGGSGIVYSLRATPTVLRSQPESEATSSTAIELPCAIGELWAGFANDTVVVSCEGKDQSLFLVESGRVEPIQKPNESHLVDLLPILGTDEAAAEVWSGGERLDGTQKTEIGRWNLKTREWLKLLDNDKMYELQAAPSNSPAWTSRLCETP